MLACVATKELEKSLTAIIATVKTCPNNQSKTT